MLNDNYNRVKLLIKMSNNFEDVDKEACEYLKARLPYDEITTRDKIAFLTGMFDVKIIDSKPDDPDEMTYAVLVSGIINSKYY